ncbi:MAG: hypothetical protein CMK74_03800 [Pseudomonadales bacterium]|nr:hypothetical protein [Pseudomonadales bacterium]
MNADDWRRLGKALQGNAELLQELAQSDEHGVNMPENPSSDLGWLIAKGLVDNDDGSLFISSLLLDIGAYVSMPGFERAAPDLEEAMIAITHHCEGYLAAKRDKAKDDAERNLKRLGHTVRQITHHLRDESLSARNYIEGFVGYSSRPSERLRDIQNAQGRLKRLQQKLTPFSLHNLRPITRGDRELRRLLTREQAFSLHAAIVRRRSDFESLIGRLDALNATVRKRNEFRQLMQAVEGYLLAGNSLDLLALMNDPKSMHMLTAPPMSPAGMIPLPEYAGEEIAAFEAVLSGLPPPRERPHVEQTEGADTGSLRVPVATSNKKALQVPFARQHLLAMANQLKVTGQPQSAQAYWLRHGSPDVEVRHWLYALSGYYLRLAADLGGKHRLPYGFEARTRPHSPHSGSRLVYDLIMVRNDQRARYATAGQ